MKSLSRVRLFETPWTAAHQALLSMGFSRPEHWSGLPCPPPGGCSQPRDQTCFPSVSCIGRQMPLAPPGKPTKALKKSSKHWDVTKVSDSEQTGDVGKEQVAGLRGTYEVRSSKMIWPVGWLQTRLCFPLRKCSRFQPHDTESAESKSTEKNSVKRSYSSSDTRTS